MRPRLRPLTASSVAGLPPTCQLCPLGADRPYSEGMAWAKAADVKWGFCGIVAHNEGRVIGHLLVSPALNLPSTHPLANGPRTPDAAVVISVRTQCLTSLGPQARAAITRQLVQSACAHLAGATGVLQAAASLGNGTCQAPQVNLLAQAGFHLDHAHVIGLPAGVRRMEIELPTTAKWVDLHHAWEALTGWVSRPVITSQGRNDLSARVDVEV